MKTILSVSLFALSFSVMAQTAGFGSGTSTPGSIDPSTNPSDIGFGGGRTINDPGTTVPSSRNTVPGTMGAPASGADVIGPSRGNEFPEQQMQDTSPDLPSTNYPSSTPAIPDTTPAMPSTVPGATNPTGTGVVPGTVAPGATGSPVGVP